MFRKIFIKKEIKLVHDSDLEILLKKIGVYDKLLSGFYKCKFTKDVISIDSLHSFFVESGEVKFVSNTPIAIKSFSEYLNNKK